MTTVHAVIAASATQALAVLLGLGALVISVQALFGYIALDPVSYTMFVLLVVILAFACAVASRSLRSAVHRAIKAGVVLELRGAPSRSALPGAIDIGGVHFCRGTSWVRFVRRDALNLVTYVEVGAPANGKLKVLVLGVNQQPFLRAERGVVAFPTNAPAPAVPAGARVGA